MMEGDMIGDGLSRESADSHSAHQALDRGADATRNGSIALMLLVAGLLVGAATGSMMLGRSHAELYVLSFLAGLATFGAFALFAVACGILRFSAAHNTNPLLKAVVDDAPEGILVTDAGGHVLYANAAYLGLTGGSGTNDARPVERVFIGDVEASEAIYRLLKAAREGRSLEEEVRIVPGKGRPAYWLCMRVRPLGSIGLAHPPTVWSLSEVTHERARQEDLLRQLQHAIDYLDHAPAGFLSADANGEIVYLNATLANWLDQDLARFGSGGLRLADLVSGDGAALLKELRATPGEVKTEVLDLDLKTRSGRTLPVRIFHKLAYGADGSPGASRTLVLNRSRDDRGDPQCAAEVRSMRFFHHTPMAIATIDRQGGTVRTNARFARLFQDALAGESGGRSIRAIVADRDWPAFAAAIRDAAAGKDDIAPIDAMLAGEGERFGRFYITAVGEQERDLEAAIVYVLETTERRALEDRLIQQQKMDSIGQLAGGMAHDFNNMLNAILLATDFLLNAHKPSDPAFQDIMEIRQSANRAASLVRHLLAFSRKQTLRPQVLDLGEVLGDLTVVLRRLIGEKIDLKVIHGRDLWPVKADLLQLEQVITNLVVNARDAMPDGGRLQLRSANLPASECERSNTMEMPAADYVLVEVADTGSGIPDAIRDKIFEPFFTTKDVGKGTGLGLSTVYGIVKQTGGFVYFDSSEQGTTFRIYLPRYVGSAQATLAPAAKALAPALAGAGEAAQRVSVDLTGEGTILLVEDEAGLRALNARGLASRGYTVLEAGNGVEAIDMLAKCDGRVDLVISDVVMPEMDGPTLLRELRSRNPGLKIIFVSGYAEDAFQKHLSADGQFPFLPKPFTLKQLVAAVKDALAA